MSADLLRKAAREMREKAGACLVVYRRFRSVAVARVYLGTDA